MTHNVRDFQRGELHFSLPEVDCPATFRKKSMKTITYGGDESRHKALLGAAKASGTSVQRLFDNFVTHVLAERQLEARFASRQKRGNLERGRRLLAEIRQRVP